MSGDSTVVHGGNYGTINVPVPTNKPGARGNATGWTTSDGKLWLFGGIGFANNNINIGYINDLWSYSITTGQWTWAKGSNVIIASAVYGTKGVAAVANTPGARGGCVGWTDANNKLWLFGGYGYIANGSSGFLNDLWKFDPATGNWTWIHGDNSVNQFSVYGTKGVAASTNKPGARFYPAYAKDAQGNLWMFGGSGYAASSNGNLNDLWKYNPATNQWTWISGDNYQEATGVYGSINLANAANKPGARQKAVCWIQGDYLYVFGGMGNDGSGNGGYLNDLWKFQISTGLWTWVKGSNTRNQTVQPGTQGVANAANYPGSRRSMESYSSSDGYFWIFGGAGYGTNPSNTIDLDDLWRYDPSTNVWTWMKGPIQGSWGVYGSLGVPAANNIPGSRIDGYGWTYNDEFWLFGGHGYSTNTTDWLSDLWKFTPSIQCNPPTVTTQPNSITVCSGSNAAFTISAAGSNLTYQWKKSGTDIPGATSNTYNIPGVTLSDAGNYTVSITGSCGNVLSNVVTLTVNTTPPVPTISATSSTSFCQGSSVTLNSSAATGNQWYKDGVLISGATNNSYTVFQAGNYTVQVTSGGCSALSNATNVIVNTPPPAPSINGSSPITICAGNTATLNTSSTTGNQWYLNGVAISGATGQTYNVSQAGNYTVINTVNGCSSPASNTVIVNLENPPSSPIVTASPSAVVCAGTTVTLNASSTGCANCSYSWSGGTAGNPILVVNSGGNYQVTVTNVCGSSAAMQTVTVNAIPTITVSTDTTICSGGNATLSASGANTYTWSPSTGLSGTSGNMVTASPSSTTVYTVTGTTSGCSASKNITVGVNLSPVPTITTSFSGCPGNAINFTSNTTNAGSAGSIQWYVNNLASGVGPNFTVNNATNGTKIFAKLTSSATCANPQVVNSDTTTINCVTTALPFIEGLEYFELRPNLSKGIFTVAFRTGKKIEFEVMDNSGRVIYVSGSYLTGSTSTKQIDLQKYPAGLYYLKTKIGNKAFVIKLIISK